MRVGRVHIDDGLQQASCTAVQQRINPGWSQSVCRSGRFGSSRMQLEDQTAEILGGGETDAVACQLASAWRPSMHSVAAAAAVLCCCYARAVLLLPHCVMCACVYALFEHVLRSTWRNRRAL
jgi:hypothetical protein